MKSKTGCKFVMFDNPANGKRELYQLPVDVYDLSIKQLSTKGIVLEDLLSGESIFFTADSLVFILNNGEVF